jgi:hypothetical protein
MPEVQLPVVDIDASVADAFAALEAGGSAAVVVADGHEHMLVFGGALLRAQDAHVASLRNVEKQPLPDEGARDDERARGFDDDAGVHYFVQSQIQQDAATEVFGVAGGAAEPAAFSLRGVLRGKATVVTSRALLIGLARPDFFRCTIYPRHTFPDPPPNVDDGDDCPKCIADPAIAVNGVVKLIRRP